MTIGGALVLIAAGAILKWAVTAQVSGIDIQTVGTVLFIVGLVGLGLALLYTFALTGRGDPVDYEVPVRQPPPPPYRT